MNDQLTAPPANSLTDRIAKGKDLRHRVPRASHAQWTPAADRPDPIALLERTSEGRLPDLIPIRYGRMVHSPFTFLRGSAAAMACDLAATPASGIRVQLCGDCHLCNFGGFGTPERNFFFDLNDFDETLPGPWEWDVKRLAASFVAAGRSISLRERHCDDAAEAVARSYRVHTHEYSRMRVLEVWYAHIDAPAVLDLASDTLDRRTRLPESQLARHRTSDRIFPRMTEVAEGKRRIVDHPPLIFHPPHDADFEQHVHCLFQHYRRSLDDTHRHLLDHYKVVDIAMKVVGVGSVGTRCAVVLLMAGDEDPLFLQYKEAGQSVLAPYAGKSQYANQGQRVVAGQRLMQAASDLMLGWSADDGRDFYFRQLRDMKAAVHVDGLTGSGLIEYAEICGWTLARAHAKSGDAAAISGYLGKSDVFDRAIAAFAHTYADQTEADHAAMQKAVESGRLVVQVEDNA